MTTTPASAQPHALSPDARAALRSARIVTGALLGGTLLFTLIAAAVALSGASPRIAQGGQGGMDLGVMLGLIAGAMAVSLTPIAIVMRRKIIRAVRQSGGENVQQYFAASIVPCALVESYGLFGATIVLLTGQVFPYVVIPLIAIVAMASMFPKAQDLAPAPGSSGIPGISGAAFAKPERWS